MFLDSQPERVPDGVNNEDLAQVTVKASKPVFEIPTLKRPAEFTALLQVRDQDGIAGLRKVKVVGLIDTPTQPHRPPQLVLENGALATLRGMSARRVNAAIALAKDGVADLTPKGLQSPAVDRYLQPPVVTSPGVEEAIQRGRHNLPAKPGSWKKNTPWLS